MIVFQNVIMMKINNRQLGVTVTFHLTFSPPRLLFFHRDASFYRRYLPPTNFFLKIFLVEPTFGQKKSDYERKCAKKRKWGMEMPLITILLFKTLTSYIRFFISSSKNKKKKQKKSTTRTVENKRKIRSGGLETIAG